MTPCQRCGTRMLPLGGGCYICPTCDEHLVEIRGPGLTCTVTALVRPLRLQLVANLNEIHVTGDNGHLATVTLGPEHAELPGLLRRTLSILAAFHRGAQRRAILTVPSYGARYHLIWDRRNGCLLEDLANFFVVLIEKFSSSKERG